MEMNDLILSRFLVSIGKVSKTFNAILTKLESYKVFKDFDTICGVRNWEEEGRPALTMGINADLHKPVNSDLHSLGLSFVIVKESDHWRFEGEVGWSSFTIGFDLVEDLENSYDTAELVILDLEENVNFLLRKWEVLINEYLDAIEFPVVSRLNLLT